MKRILTLVTISALFLGSCSKDDKKDNISPIGQATLTFDSRVNTEDFALNKDFTIGGTKYKFTQLRYWVSNVSLINDKGETYNVPNSYFLLEENNAIDVQGGAFSYPARKREEVTISDIPAGNYKAVSFSIGVDAEHNDNLSLQAGELSQLNGMTNISWMWHTSYIFSSLKGSRIVGTDTTGITVETGLNTNYRSLKVDLPAAVAIGGKTASIKFNVDVTKIIEGLDLAKTPVIGASQKTEMTLVADNYSKKAILVSGTSNK
ncbi:hypothetical protein DVR12_02850 [Chitinophaga silvatica]|uniref:Copper-binding protein MbnP-like domain-containing protein n=1 Tax=Chitinophaga silvatica TaxID=2282649 RepID=A0A3E1YHN0_9BACT|nr:MbnP family protein [Chitinophaga silvatica]RFS26740.1 hypothetical protein DVR12_02850 [Chitinophaga silvatica]